MSALFAFLHHVAAFAIFAALAVELVLLKEELNVPRARKLLRVDFAFGMAAVVLLVVGLLRVFYFEKGAGYYFHSIPFIVKLSLFAAVGLASIYPTMQFLSWRGALKEGRAPMVAPGRMRALRMVVHAELAAVVVILLCAALMARGIGYVA
jgi:putative membrane protein